MDFFYVESSSILPEVVKKGVFFTEKGVTLTRSRLEEFYQIFRPRQLESRLGPKTRKLAPKS